MVKIEEHEGELPLIKRTETLAAFPPTNTIDMIPQTLKKK